MATEEQLSGATLAAAVDRERKRASVRSLDISFNELADMHETRELHINPEYQRTFRWSLTKQSQFIESIILEMPLPPIYAVESGEGQWELIDGLQRLSTYLHFRGQLHLPEHEPPITKDVSFLELEGCNIIKELNRFTFAQLPTALQHRVRRTPLRVEVVRRESNPRFAYYMFIRLNQGGEQLSEQEARNCAIRLLGDRFITFVSQLTEQPSFQTCVEDITDDYRARMGLDELVLRFFAFKNNLAEFVHDIHPFMTNFMERVTDESAPDRIPFDYITEARIFKQTFDLLARTLGSDCCRRWVESRTSWGGGFAVGQYEALTIGVSRVINEVPEAPDETMIQKLTNALTAAKRDPGLRSLTVGGGKNFRSIYEQKFNLVANHIRAAL